MKIALGLLLILFGCLGLAAVAYGLIWINAMACAFADTVQHCSPVSRVFADKEVMIIAAPAALLALVAIFFGGRMVLRAGSGQHSDGI